MLNSCAAFLCALDWARDEENSWVGLYSIQLDAAIATRNSQLATPTLNKGHLALTRNFERVIKRAAGLDFTRFNQTQRSQLAARNSASDNKELLALAW